MLNYIIRRLTHKFTTAYGFSEPFFCSPKPAVENLWIMRGDLMKNFFKYYVFALLVAKLKEVNQEFAQSLSFVLGLRKKKLNKTQTSTT